MSGPAASRVLARLPEYPFAALEAQARRAGTGPRVLRFAIGDPDLPPPRSLQRAALAAMGTPDGNRYSSSRGEEVLREAFARWFTRRFRVRVDPSREVAVLVGSKEGIAALPRAVLEPGERVVVPDPGYPAYSNAALLARMRPVPLPLDPKRGWLPDWERLPIGGRLLYLNYPNNPTGAVAGLDDLREAVDRARDGRFAIAYDNAYSEITFAGATAPSILEVPGAREHVVEFHSLSKTLGIPGWRIGFAVGDANRIEALTALKSHSDSGAAKPLQIAAAQTLDGYGATGWPKTVRRSIEAYGHRLRRLSDGLATLGWDGSRPVGTLYLWQRVPEGEGGAFAQRLFEQHRILVTPGAAFGPRGRRYVRWAATAPEKDIDEALARIRTS